MKRIGLFLGILLMGTLLFACTPETEKPALQGTLAPKAPALAKEGDSEQSIGLLKAEEVEWERAMKGAKKEGRLTLINTTLATQTAGDVFSKKYGIEVGMVSGGGGELAAKLISEQRAGIFATDIYIGGGNTLVARLKPSGILAPLYGALILPEVKNPAAWLGGKIPFIDKESFIFSLARYPQHPLSINTDLVQLEEIQSYKDLLNPKWKGKIVSGDPTKTGSALKWFSAMVEEAHGPILGLDYMRQFVKQEPVILRDDRLAAEWLIRGKYPIVMNMGLDILFQGFQREGIKVPVKQLTPKEGGYLTTGANNMALLKKAPHPDASKLFINWLLSREGQLVWEKASTKHSTRIDLPPPEEINPAILARKTGTEYVFMDTEELLLKTDEYISLSTQIFGQLTK